MIILLLKAVLSTRPLEWLYCISPSSDAFLKRRWPVPPLLLEKLNFLHLLLQHEEGEAKRLDHNAVGQHMASLLSERMSSKIRRSLQCSRVSSPSIKVVQQTFNRQDVAASNLFFQSHQQLKKKGGILSKG